MNLIDLHCDTIYRIFTENKKARLRDNSFHVDINKLEKSNSIAQFFALFLDLEEIESSPLEHTLAMLDRFYQELKENQDKIKIACSYKELIENQKNGKISAFLTIEEGQALEGSLTNLRNFYRLGVRLITLTWNYPNTIGYPNTQEEYRSKGLSLFGKKVVKEMNKLGMLIDVSHLSDQGFYDVAKLSTSPFIASHSNARIIRNHSRNLTDAMIRTLANKGGIMGINFSSSFLANKEISEIADIIKHIKYIHKVGGIDTVALGSDFDGIDCELELGNIGEMDKLYSALKKAGFNEDDIEKIYYKNAERVIKEVLK
ncbi:peptidase M19 [Orenia metallireducens]|uniref:Peptidase M19 n=1 Tax=Orenia metallireducens TaxID=1413210 RepID=A0A1C0A7B6_9FIRM|nr:dipeptidase [Orenia metallireducens]OCL26104.1 peptidase M19 [Orenia metallireducens]